MRKLYLLFLLLFSFVSPAHEDRGLEYFEHGERAYQNQSYPESLLYLRRAQKVWGMYKYYEIEKRIADVQVKISGTAAKPAQKIKQRIDKHLGYIRAIPLIFWQFLFLIIWFFLFFYLADLYKKKRHYLISLLFISMTIIGVMLVVRYKQGVRMRGVVMRDSVVYTGPSTKFRKLTLLPQGDEVSILRKSESFFKIKSPHIYGWVSQKAIGRV